MKPHVKMTEAERKAYLNYVFNNNLTPEETREYWDYMSDVETELGCDTSVVPIEIIRQGQEAADAHYEKVLEKRAKGNAEIRF